MTCMVQLILAPRCSAAQTRSAVGKPCTSMQRYALASYSLRTALLLTNLSQVSVPGRITNPHMHWPSVACRGKGAAGVDGPAGVRCKGRSALDLAMDAHVQPRLGAAAQQPSSALSLFRTVAFAFAGLADAVGVIPAEAARAPYHRTSQVACTLQQPLMHCAQTQLVQQRLPRWTKARGERLC